MIKIHGIENIDEEITKELEENLEDNEIKSELEQNLEDNETKSELEESDILNFQNEFVEENYNKLNEQLIVNSQAITSYSGKVYVDFPTSFQNFTRPKYENIEIRGWAVSNDSNATLKILIDNREVESTITRTERQDVDNIISPEYGGKENTPNAGFIGNINFDNMSQGIHNLKVQEFSRYGELIASYEMTINILNQKFEGRAYIDVPLTNQIITRPDEDNFEVQGWSVSNDINSILKILVDDKEMESTITRVERSDVDSSISLQYGGLGNTPYSGFIGLVNLSNLSQGMHNLKVQEISRYGELITTYEVPINIVNKKFRGEAYIDSPIFNSNYIRPDISKVIISGWAVSTDSEARIKIFIDGKEFTGTTFRETRRDIDSIVSPKYGGRGINLHPGFHAVVNTDDLEKGKHNIKILNISRYGDIISENITEFSIENKQYSGQSYIDYPVFNSMYTKPDDTVINLSGWAVAEDNIANLKLFVDGNMISDNLTRFLREDVDKIVSPLYGGKDTTPYAGFTYELNINNFSAGSHIIRLEEVSRYGDLISAQETVFNIQNKKYLGEMCIDYPTFNSNYEQGSGINIAGWAVSQDELASVHIYLDGNYLSEASRYYREDVVYFMNKYDGKTLNAGYGKRISTSGLACRNT